MDSFYTYGKLSSTGKNLQLRILVFKESLKGNFLSELALFPLLKWNAGELGICLSWNVVKTQYGK